MRRYIYHYHAFMQTPTGVHHSYGIARMDQFIESYEALQGVIAMACETNGMMPTEVVVDSFSYLGRESWRSAFRRLTQRTGADHG